MLDKPAKLDVLFGFYNLSTYRHTPDPMRKEVLIRLFGAYGLENGHLQSDWYNEYLANSLLNYNVSSRQIDFEAEFIKSLDEHDESLRKLFNTTIQTELKD